MFKGGSIKPMIIALLAISAIMISFSFPYLVFAYENHNLNGYGIHYNADPVRINSASVTFTEKLRNMTSAIDNSSYVYVSEDSTTDFEAKLTADEAANAAADAFMNVFVTDEMIGNLGMDRTTLRSLLFESKDHFTSRYLMIRPGSKDMYLVWVVGAYNDFGDMELLIDDETGMLLSVYVYLNQETKLSSIFSENYSDEAFGKTLADYYEMKYIASEYSASRRSSSKNLAGTGFSVRSIKLMGADPDEEIVLPYVVEPLSGGAFMVYYNFYSYSALNLDAVVTDIQISDYYINDYNVTDVDNASTDADENTETTGQNAKSSKSGKTTVDGNESQQEAVENPEDAENAELTEEASGNGDGTADQSNTNNQNNANNQSTTQENKDNNQDTKKDVDKGTATDADKKEN